VLQGQESRVPGASLQKRVWPRLMYRNVTDISSGFSVAATVTAETDTTLRPALSYDPPSHSSGVFASTALLNYRGAQGLEFGAGLDQLPSGLNIPDLSLWIKSRNRLGYYDVPAQVKMVWTGSRVHLEPFVYAPTGHEGGDGEGGVRTLAEFVFGRRAVVGTSLVDGSSRNGDRRMVGGYLRLGFGGWGILAENDFTERSGHRSASFAQNASYVRVFGAIREWLVAAGSLQRLRVEPSFEGAQSGGQTGARRAAIESGEHRRQHEHPARPDDGDAFRAMPSACLVRCSSYEKTNGWDESLCRPARPFSRSTSVRTRLTANVLSRCPDAPAGQLVSVA
jgi:hypothetical protein